MFFLVARFSAVRAALACGRALPSSLFSPSILRRELPWFCPPPSRSLQIADPASPRTGPAFGTSPSGASEEERTPLQPPGPSSGAPPTTMEVSPWKKWAALVIFAVQNAGAVLLMRYSKLLRAPPYSNVAAVMMQELVKLLVSTTLYMQECGGPFKMRPREGCLRLP